jgi:hypothetical protein
LINKDYRKRKALIESERQALQKEFFEKEAVLFQSKPSMDALEKFSSECLKAVEKVIVRWSKFM